MSDFLVDLLPLIMGAALVPLYPIVVLLLLQSQNGLGKAVAFITGGLVVRIVQGILFGFVFVAADEAYPEDGSELIVDTLLLVVGLLLLVAAFKKWRKEPDPDEPPPEWMATIGSLSVLKAVGTGAAFLLLSVKQWVFTLSAIGVITEADLAGATGIRAYLFFVLATQLLVLPPIFAYAFAPQRAAKPLQATQAWLERHNRTIVVSLSLVFGIWFMFKGLSGLVN